VVRRVVPDIGNRVVQRLVKLTGAGGEQRIGRTVGERGLHIDLGAAVLGDAEPDAGVGLAVDVAGVGEGDVAVGGEAGVAANVGAAVDAEGGVVAVDVDVGHIEPVDADDAVGRNLVEGGDGVVGDVDG